MISKEKRKGREVSFSLIFRDIYVFVMKRMTIIYTFFLYLKIDQYL